MNFYDSHTHLNSPLLYPKHEQLIKNFINIWWKLLVNVWVDYERTERWIKITEKYNMCLATWGFHPSEVIFKEKNWKYEFYKDSLWWNDYLKKVKSYLENLAEKRKIVAIGECWLDYHYKEKDNSNLSSDTINKQKELFNLQCKIAEKYDLPLVIHSRDAFYDTVEVLKNFKNLKIYFHCWGYSLKEIEVAKSEFPSLWVWFDWNITYKKADDLRSSIKALPIENLLIETDAPYLTPQIIRKEQNQPANVKYIYEYIADLKDISLVELSLEVEKNFFRYYSI